VDAARLEKRNRMTTLKELARNTQHTPSQIVAAATINMPQSVAGQFGTTMQLTHTVNRTRTAARGAPTNPTDLLELVIPNSYTKTHNEDPLLLFDSGAGADRILLFSTSNNLRTLSQCDDWYADGTFKSSPPLFKQIFSVHGVKSEVTLPLVYGLLPNKEQDSYTRFLSAMETLATSEQVAFQPKSILTDFEAGCLNAFEEVFPGAERRGCYFHHTQCIWKHLQQFPDILSKYNNDPDFAHHIRQLPALAFVPLEDITSSYDVLMNTPFYEDNDALLRPLLDYYEDTWIGRPRRGGRRAPLFPRTLWNCFTATADGNPRTNNKVEGWNKRFNTLIGIKHPTVWTFIDKLKDEQSVTELKMNQILAGTPSAPRRKKYRDLEKRLLRVVADYGNRSVSDYLIGIAHNLQFYT